MHRSIHKILRSQHKRNNRWYLQNIRDEDVKNNFEGCCHYLPLVAAHLGIFQLAASGQAQSKNAPAVNYLNAISTETMILLSEKRPLSEPCERICASNERGHLRLLELGASGIFIPDEEGRAFWMAGQMALLTHLLRHDGISWYKGVLAMMGDLRACEAANN
jgi:hypothetical protein